MKRLVRPVAAEITPAPGAGTSGGGRQVVSTKLLPVNSLAGSPHTKRVTTITLASFVALGLSTLLLGPSIAKFAERAHISKERAGILFTFGAVGYFAGSLLAGQLLKNVPALRLSSVGLGLSVAALLGCAFSSSLPLLGLSQMVLGLGAALIDVTGNALILWMHRGGSVMAALHMCFSVGSIFSALVIAKSLDWSNELRWAYVVVAALLAAIALVMMSTASPENPHDASASNSRLHSKQKKMLVLGVLFYFSYVGVEVGFFGWVVDYGVARGLSRTGGATVLATVFAASFAAGRLISVPIARKVGPFEMLMADVALCVMGLGLLIASPSRGMMWFATVLFGLGTASMFPSMLSLIEPVLPSTGAVTSAFLAGSSVGTMVVPPIIGAFLKTSTKAMPIVVLIGTVCCLVLVLAFRSLSSSVRRESSRTDGPFFQT